MGSVEFALVQKDVMFGLKRGTEVLKEVQREMGGIEGVEKLMMEGEEARAFQQVCGSCLHSDFTCWDESLDSKPRKYLCCIQLSLLHTNPFAS